MGSLALILVIFTGLYKVVLCLVYGRNVYVPDHMTWSEAREYCREHYIDLSVTVNQFELLFALLPLQEEEGASGDDHFIWTGLKEKANTTQEPKPLLTILSPQKDPDDDHTCVAQNADGFETLSCIEKFPFFCFKSSLVLVKENKNWEEAMEHCRSMNADLVSVPSESALVEVLQTSGQSQTARVWTGLRYLADTWLWVDGAKYQTLSQADMPQCPDWSRLCGALGLEEQQLDSWDCADTFNFVCHPKNRIY